MTRHKARQKSRSKHRLCSCFSPEYKYGCSNRRRPADLQPGAVKPDQESCRGPARTGQVLRWISWKNGYEQGNRTFESARVISGWQIGACAAAGSGRQERRETVLPKDCCERSFSRAVELGQRPVWNSASCRTRVNPDSRNGS